LSRTGHWSHAKQDGRNRRGIAEELAGSGVGAVILTAT